MKMRFALCSLLLATSCVLQAQDPGKNSPEETKDHRAKILARFDTNHNGVLDPDEKAALQKWRAERLAKYDKNGDGRLDKSEREAMKADRKAHRPNKSGTPTISGTTTEANR